MKKPHVKAAIQEEMQERSIRTGIDQDMVVRALSRVAFSNIKDFVHWVALSVPADFIDGDPGGIIIRPVDEIDVDKLSAIAELSSNGGRRKIRLYDKLKALELLGKHLGTFGQHAYLSVNYWVPSEGISVASRCTRAYSQPPI